MAFNDPPNILAGISHPQVISTPGAGEAMAGGLSAVLASILQKQQLDQQHQSQQADLAYKQAQTEQELQLAKLTGANTDKAQQETKDLKKKAQDLTDQQQYERTALGFVNAHLDKINDFGAMLGEAHKAIQAGAIPQDILPYLGGMVQKTAGVNKDVNDALKAKLEAQKDQALLPGVVPQQQADIRQKNAEAGAAQALTATRQQDLRDAQQKQTASEMGKYLLAAKATVPSGSDDLAAVPKAMAQYVADKRRANPKWTPPADLTTQFLAASQSPVTGLKATDIDRVSKMYTSDPQVKPLMARASQYQTALGALQSAAKGNKAASGSAYINVIKAIDQPTNLRFMMLDWAKSNIDPDFGNDIRKGFDKKFHGVIPANVVRDMYQHMVDMRAADKTQLTNSYNWYRQHYPEAADKIKDPDTIFGKDEDYQLTSSSAAPSDSVTNQLMKKYGLTPR